MRHVNRLLATMNLLIPILFIMIWNIPIYKWSLYTEIVWQTEAPISFCISFLAWIDLLLIASIMTMVTDRKNIFTILSCIAWLATVISAVFYSSQANSMTYTFWHNATGYMQFFGTTVLSIIILLREKQITLDEFKRSELGIQP